MMIVKWNNEIPKDDKQKLLKLTKFIGPSRYRYENRYLIGYWNSIIECWVDSNGEEINDVEGWTELVESPMTAAPVVAYICDRKAKCRGSIMCGKECTHTVDIAHAVNFKPITSDNGKCDRYWEEGYDGPKV